MASGERSAAVIPKNYTTQGQIKTMIFSSCLGSFITIIVISFLLRNTAFINIYLTNNNVPTSDSVGTQSETTEERVKRSYATEAKLILLPYAAKKGAVCLDGSPPGYYYRAGFGKGVGNWIIHFFGGAWCFDEKACLQRSKTVLGSSTFFPPHPPKLQGILSSNPKTNPDFYNWNLVMMCYCDGASFSGYRREPVRVNGEYIYLRGRRILEVIFEELMQSDFRNARRVLLTGTSAGGLAVIIHSDFIRSLLPSSTDVRAVSDSGYFVDVPSVDGGNIVNRHFKKMFDVHNSAIGINEECVRSAVPRYRWKCLFPQHTLRFLHTPIFILQSAFDAWQMIHIRGINCQVPNFDFFTEKRSHVTKRSSENQARHKSWAYKHIHGIYCKPPECTERELADMLEFRNLTLRALAPVIRSRDSGLYLTSCMEHSQSLYDDTWTDVYINEVSIAQAISNWCFGRTDFHYHVDCGSFSCNPTCSSVW
ncbi:pectin acetylesterase 11-like [Exaiptasia diaphana]|uniref:Pectin acetylesterase n=1 Tax=Exaiptasia diaphana TaxID=2652724 RepID=A0A913X6K1_EXADI|nr:pectin acetylesterase 11-like [Exaiptasia diaphana]